MLKIHGGLQSPEKCAQLRVVEIWQIHHPSLCSVDGYFLQGRIHVCTREAEVLVDRMKVDSM